MNFIHYVDLKKQYGISFKGEDDKEIGELYCDFVDKIIKHVTSMGKTVMMWGDIALEHPDALNRIPKDTIFHKKIGREIWVNDSINQIRVREILDTYPLDFGEENEVVWAVIQHSSLEIQEQYLPKFIDAVEKGKLRGEFVAVMKD